MVVITTILINTIAVFCAATILGGVKVSGFLTAMVVAVLLGFINTFIRPVILIFTMPLNVLTLGLFTFIIIGGLTMLVSALVPGFYVANFMWALLFAFVLAVINSFLFSLL